MEKRGKMFVESSISSCRRRIDLFDRPVSLIPTMGNLHEGHLKMIAHAREKYPDDAVVVSVFINPVQFERTEDYLSYPRTKCADIRRLDELGVDLVFLPKKSQMYPHGTLRITTVDHPISNELEGSFRPGHFSGVSTVVAKLFNIVRPVRAYFGEKDYQQLIMIRKMVIDLNYSIDVVGFPIVREKDGLAYSSRNTFLPKEKRLVAWRLNSTLEEVVDRYLSRECISEEQCLNYFKRRISQFGFDTESLLIRDAQSLSSISSESRDVVILASVRLGAVRLIDNKVISYRDSVS
ncbi:pantoate--beta-alanine ligase [Candidatus Riesia pediculischaeffi]|uniref:Pantothenate synthetase n=1 Tax=Candidatus Riesia pediculischaeffi PTSU TaxID=1401651 RepID=A0A0C1RZK2_9ENTR|nr:pantoate--beta-alanine ligase [Candidatus Riesia pediculischaeffi]KIE63722.1 pantoate-beta-alanine ligase [Candidatus Riesia pediculischaeffi PTSU]